MRTDDTGQMSENELCQAGFVYTMEFTISDRVQEKLNIKHGGVTPDELRQCFEQVSMQSMGEKIIYPIQ
jgi:acyl-CoA synthetase (AMP-forming)/AMP-acid ligase II